MRIVGSLLILYYKDAVTAVPEINKKIECGFYLPIELILFCETKKH